jgi:hypothetical protein
MAVGGCYPAAQAWRPTTLLLQATGCPPTVTLGCWRGSPTPLPRAPTPSWPQPLHPPQLGGGYNLSEPNKIMPPFAYMYIYMHKTPCFNMTFFFNNEFLHPWILLLCTSLRKRWHHMYSFLLTVNKYHIYTYIFILTLQQKGIFIPRLSSSVYHEI